MLKNIEVRLEIFKEVNCYVAVCPDLDVSSFGDTLEEAKQSVQEALEAFFEECERMGTLTLVLEESGFVQQNGNWLPRQPVFSQLVTIG